jgi:hypothetical protein
MSASPFDTFALVDTPGKGGISDGRAHSITAAFASATADRLATKSDLKELGLSLKAHMAEIKTGIVRWFLVTAISSVAPFITAAKSP